MKKTYIIPQTIVVRVVTRNMMLSVSDPTANILLSDPGVSTELFEVKQTSTFNVWNDDWSAE